ncbi:facilitated trehalose transporter Tret1-2 homolog isoform X1 [Myzus persicae]|uniref:facilitated trehalose transporter Tret1-2 homolog isoform X1 n=2 Tax=Myzus persicae TaxID=13164 RepID=UPI000B93690E|nr:facilitated trehalose transporter Tret1-2 homolog isoform X1 [Myzus persicae]
MESNEKTNLISSHVYTNYSSKPHHLHYTSAISRVLWLALVVTMPCLAPGMSFGYSAIVLDQLQLTVDEQSWFASLPSTMMPIGCLLSGPLIDKLGRKTALMVTNLPSCLGWLLLSRQPASLYLLYAGQLLVGMSVGLSTTPATVYAAECITVNYTGLRGCFTIMTSIMLNFGMFLTYLLGTLMPAYVVAYVAAFVSFAAFIFIGLLIPESPPWLFGQGRRGDAEFSQRVLRIAQPILQTSRAMSLDGDTAAMVRVRSRIVDRLAEPDVYKPMVIMTTFLFFQQACGSFVLTAYMIQLLGGLGVTVDNYLVTLLAGFTNLAAMVVLSVLLTRSGFKQLSYVSCAGYAASMVLLAVFLQCYDGGDAFVTNVVVIGCVLLNMAMNGLGLRPIPYAMLGEVFPTDVAGVAGSIVACMSSVFNFVAIKSYPYLRICLGPGVFAVYGALALLTLVFVVVIVPDTRGKTIKQISDEFLRKKSDSGCGGGGYCSKRSSIADEVI